MQQLYRQLSELMGGMLPPFVAPANNIHVLDIGWGMGESVYETALQYPSTHITGIDRDVSTVKQAQSLVRGLNNATVFVHDMRHFEDTVLLPASFSLIHLHVLVGCGENNNNRVREFVFGNATRDSGGKVLRFAVYKKGGGDETIS